MTLRPDGADPARRARPPRRRIVLVASLALGAGVIAAVVIAVLLTTQVLAAKRDLQAVQADIVTLRARVGQPGTSTAALGGRLAGHADDAVADTDGPVWGIGEAVPALGPNLAGVRQVARSSPSSSLTEPCHSRRPPTGSVSTA